MIDVPLAIQIAATSSADVFYTILKKLSFKDMSSFYMLLKKPNPENHILLAALKKKLGSSKAIESLHGLLKLLKSMDETIAIDAPTKHQNNVLWYFRAVMQASYAIYRRQNDEIAYLKQRHPNHEQWANINTQDINAEDINFEVLITRHQQLEALNESIIRSKIDRRSNEFNLSGVGITRIPEALFHDESLAVYWRNVISFNCGFNQLQQLPNALGNLVALQTLYCSSNQLQNLPDTIGNLVALQRLFCNHNQLQHLPETIGTLVALQELYCSYNQLQHLPETIGNLVALQELYCSCNELQQLPDTIGNLVALEELDCNKNLLLELPKRLQDKFGKNWCNAKLAEQRRPNPQRAILPQYAAAVAPIQRLNQAEDTDNALTNNLANLKLN